MNKINKLRKDKKLTVDKFAEELGVSKSCVMKFMYGEREPSIKFLKAIKTRYPEVDMNVFFET